MEPSHRRADDAGTASESARVGQEGLEAMRRYGIDSPCSWRTRSRRWSRSATGTRPTGSAPPRSAASPRALPSGPHHPRCRRDRPRTSTPRERTRGRARHAARGSRPRPLRRHTSQSSPSGSAAGPTPKRQSTRTGLGTPARRCADARLVPRRGLRAQAELQRSHAHAGRARPARLSRARSSSPPPDVSRGGLSGVTPTRRLACPGGGRVRTCPRRRTAGVMV